MLSEMQTPFPIRLSWPMMVLPPKTTAPENKTTLSSIVGCFFDEFYSFNEPINTPPYIFTFFPIYAVSPISMCEPA